MHERAQFEHNSKCGAYLAVKLLGICSTTLTYAGLPAMVPQVFLILGRHGNNKNPQAEHRSHRSPVRCC